MQTLQAERVLSVAEGTALIRDSMAPDLAPTVALGSGLPTTIVLDGRPVAAYLRLDVEQRARLRATVLAYPMERVLRGSGIRNRGAVFGFLGPSGMLKRYGCRASRGSLDAPRAHAALCGFASDLGELLRSVNPEQYAANLAAVDEIRPEWLLPGGLWTSGVVNLNSLLPYHRDRNNLDGWSAMPVIRRGVRGGHLHFPELEVDGAPLVFPCRDGDVLMFDGQKLIHGVTPFRTLDADAYRYTAVYYPVKKMRSCLAVEVDLARARQRTTTREDGMIAKQRAAGWTP